MTIHQGISVSKQSIDERFSSEALQFVQQLISIQMNSCSEKYVPVLDKFSSVLIHDSTKFKLPESIQEHYKGYSVKGMAAGASLQFCYDLLNAQFKELKLTEATHNDSLEAIENVWVEKGSLLIRDLGYFSIDALEEINHKQAYYLSKVKPRTNLFLPDGQKFDLKELDHKMSKYSIDRTSHQLLMGKGKLPVRAVFQKVPDHVYQERIRSKQSKNKSRGWNMTEEYRLWSKWNVFITNATEDMLSDDQMLTSYKLRWQIELIFKTWKSHYQLHKTKEMKKARIEIYIYSTLLLILIHWKLYRWLDEVLSQQKLAVSLYKFSKYILQLSYQFNNAIIGNKNSLDSFISYLEGIPVEFISKEKRRNKLCYSDIIYGEYE